MKASEMMVCWAGEFISATDDPQEKQGRLGFAVTAWNLACMPQRDREQAVARFLSKLREVNPTGPNQGMKHDLDTLITSKLLIFPNEQRQFMSARIDKNELGKDAVTVTFVPQD